MRQYEKNNKLDAIYGPYCRSKAQTEHHLYTSWTVSARPGSSSPPAHWSQACLWQSILPPSLSQLWCTPRLYPWTSHSVDILYVDMTLAPPCQRHTAKLSAQLWMQNERR